MNKLFFVRNQAVSHIEETLEDNFEIGKLEYTAGKLSPIGLRTGPEVVDDLHNFLKKKYAFDIKTKKATTKEGNAAYRFLYNRGIELMMSDATESLTWETILTWAT